MLENSLDAGSTQIMYAVGLCFLHELHALILASISSACSVTVKDGGKALLQIQDNGHGVQVGCRRHVVWEHLQE
jgi:DNA mismatch repair ATPase MutL